MLSSGYNGLGSKGALAAMMAGFFDNATVTNRGGVTGMVLADSFADLARHGEGFYTRTAHVTLPGDMYDGGFDSDIRQGVGGLLDTIVDRAMGQSLRFGGPDNAGSRGAQTRALEKNLQGAWQRAQGAQKETVKLNDRQMTTASGQGVERTGAQIRHKADAARNLQAAAAQMRKEGAARQDVKQAGSQQVGGKFVRDTVISTVAGMFAETVMPGAGTMVAAMGAGSFVADKIGKSAFASAADGTGMVRTSPGHQTVDIMGGRPAMTGRQFDIMMAQGPGFGHLPGEIEHIVEPGLDIQCTFSEKQVAALEARAQEMKNDAALGRTMFSRHLDAKVPVTESIGDTPITALDVKPEQEAALTSDNPELRQESLKTAVISPRAFG